MASQACESMLRVHVENHNLEGLRRAIEGVDINTAVDSCHLKPGRQESMRLFLKENESVVERACLLGHLDMLEMFLLHGCSSNLPTSHGRLIHTVLTAIKAHRWLVDSGTALATIRLLFTLDCDVNVKNYQGKSPLLLAAELADVPIMAEIITRCLPWQLTCPERDNRHTPLHMACMNGSVGCVRLLLDRLPRDEAVVDIGDCLNLSPLLCSMMVLKHNVNFHRRDGRKDDALLTVQYSHIAIVEMLLNQGARPTKPVSPTYEAPSGASTSPIANALSPHPTCRSALQTALEVAHQYEVHRVIICHKCEEQPTVKKLATPYAELVRMIVQKCDLSPFTTNELEVWANAHPYIQGLLQEINTYLQIRESRRRNAPNLLSLSRHAIRIQAAKANGLSNLESLPLPRKLKDYVRFIDL
ncbi:ankyrin repeat-containing protein [Plakobranchus ocellatus]|uniref:Ankyrin repeat-containing protein n=1 Tax=Plakobranchus ocellatus TaxID=259542 RepID=A0AAV4DUH1_9GAST|nr:ankyrin repeat-containing protein [Plakobranchus ocellatus]